MLTKIRQMQQPWALHQQKCKRGPGIVIFTLENSTVTRIAPIRHIRDTKEKRCISRNWTTTSPSTHYKTSYRKERDSRIPWLESILKSTFRYVLQAKVSVFILLRRTPAEKETIYSWISILFWQISINESTRHAMKEVDNSSVFQEWKD